MRKLAVVLFLTIAVLPFIYGQKTRPGQLPKIKQGADYSLKVHVTGVHIRSDCSTARLTDDPCKQIYADAVIDEKKIELMGAEVSYPSYKRFNVLPGDYKARLFKDPHTDGTGLGMEYEVVLSGEVVWHCKVTGISE
jgi:hypothetical protein